VNVITRHSLGWAQFLFLAFGVALIAGAVIVAMPARGADHRDSPGVEGDPGADIADVYAFRSPTNADNLVIALDVNGLTAPAQNTSRNFATDVTYSVHVDNNGDLTADATAKINFSGNPLTFTVAGLTASPITGPVTPPSSSVTPSAPQITTSGPIKVFAGQRDDPFYFDLVAFKKFVAGPYAPGMGLRPPGETPVDTFAGTNISTIVIEAPITALTGAANSNTGVIKAWATTTRGSQVDRMAIPAINTALIPSAQKEAFNKANPANDVAAFRPTAKATIDALRAAVAPILGAQTGGPLGNLTSDQVAAALIPDVVTIDFSKPVQFPNGRRLQDDVIDAALGVVLNYGGATGIPDAINSNDKAFLSSFPYLADPFQPAAAPPSVGLPTSGGAPLSQNDGFNWQFPLMLSAGALLAASGLGLMVLRRKVN